jgi:hypothetical protein
VKSEHDRSATYQLVIRGELDERFGFLFEGMQMKRTEGTTVLSGRIPDQAKLMGFIERIDELGLELLSVQKVATSQPGSEQERMKYERQYRRRT